MVFGDALIVNAALRRRFQTFGAPWRRLRRGHGHTGAEIWAIRYGRLERVPDLVVFPESDDDVARVVTTARSRNACVLPHLEDAFQCLVERGVLSVSTSGEHAWGPNAGAVDELFDGV